MASAAPWRRKLRVACCGAALASVALVPAALATPAFADEGFWPLLPPPVAAARAAWGGEVDPALFERLAGASVRLRASRDPPDHAASGSFVGRNGLLLTCRHVVTPFFGPGDARREALERRGHLATHPPLELAVPGLEVEWVRSVEDVTERVNGGLPRHLHHSDVRLAREAARAALIAEVEQQEAARAAADPGAVARRVRVVGAWGEERQLLERYERFNDVRLVFLPEHPGSRDVLDDRDPPELDVALLRVYRNGAAVRPEQWLAVAAAPAQAGDAVLSLGHPSQSSRSRSAAELDFLATTGNSLRLEALELAIAALDALATSERSLDARALLRKRLGDELSAEFWASLELGSPAEQAARGAERERLRAAFAAEPARLAAWEARETLLAHGFAAYREFAARDFWCERLEQAADAATGRGDASRWWWRERLYGGGYARHSLPDWLPEANDRHRFADALLAAWLAKVRERFERDDPLRVALDGFEPSPSLTALDPESVLGRQESIARDRCYEELRNRLAPVVRTLLAASETAFGPSFMYADPHGEERLRFARFGTAAPAAANGYARYSFGRVGGDRSGCTFESDCDSLSGCSGGAVVGRDGALLGVQSRSGFREERFDPDARSTAVDVHGLLEVLRRVYRADGLVDQLTGE